MNEFVSMQSCNLKAAKSIKFSRHISNSGWITIYHPGYESENAPLFSLPVVDSATDGSKRGIHYGTLHTACAIVANNRFDGFLSREKSPSGVPSDIGIHDIVEEGRYYFHVPNVEDGEPYEVVSCFENWTLPHGDISKLFLDLGNNKTTEIPTHTPPLSECCAVLVLVKLTPTYCNGRLSTCTILSRSLCLSNYREDCRFLCAICETSYRDSW